MKRIILASKSPRRRELLKIIGLKFEVHESPWNEEETEDKNFTPEELCKYNSCKKVNSLDISREEDCIIIGCDTIVVLDDIILGKPASKTRAREMLSLLSGKTHTVYSGLTVRENRRKKEITESVATRVKFRLLTEKEINSYISTKEPLDKAGAYGIQGYGSLLVEKIDGCYYNVVGLPLTKLYEILTGMDIDIWSYL